MHNVKYKLNEKKVTQLPMQCSDLESHFIDEKKCQIQRQQNTFEPKSLHLHKRPLINYGQIHQNKPLCFEKCLMKHIALIRVHNLFRKLTDACAPLSFHVGPPPTSNIK